MEVLRTVSKRVDDDLKIIITLSRSWKEYVITVMEVFPGGFTGDACEMYFESGQEASSAFEKIFSLIKDKSINSITEITNTI
jgi:hypothetical protein